MLGLSRSKSCFLAVGLLLSLGFSGCSSKEVRTNTYLEDIQLRKPDPQRVSQGEGVRLSEALKKPLTKEVNSPDRDRLLAFISKAQIKKPGRKDELVFSECQKKFKNAQECSFVKSDWINSLFDDEEDTEGAEAEVALKPSQRSGMAKLSRAEKRKHLKVITRLQASLKAGKVEKIPGQIEGDYYRALRGFREWSSELETLSKNFLSEKSCLDSEFYSYLGLKAEEFFPDEERVKTAELLYLKVDQCNQSATLSKYVQLARFRLGLISIMKNDCEQAQAVFTRLARMGANDYSSRALYWNAYCARKEEKRNEFLASFDELFRMNPLGYHTLSINNGDSILVDNISKPIDPIVKTRTQRDGQMNTWIHLIEDFDQMGDVRTVYALLTPARKTPEFLLRLEPGIRLYLATFAYRSRDMISLFRMLDSVFRTQSEYVVDSTLRLFYPLRHEEKIFEGAKKVNPLLIAALIRQESAFQDDAHSRVGAMGLMQLMPGTAKIIDRKVKKKDLLKPEVNIRIGINYFEMLVSRYNGDVELALAAYNAGAEVVDRWQKRYPTKSRLLFLDLIPYAETRNYVTLIGRNYYWYSKIYSEQMKSHPNVAQSAETEFRGMKSE
jgi:soluble lytic murein transglycosylase